MMYYRITFYKHLEGERMLIEADMPRQKVAEWFRENKNDSLICTAKDGKPIRHLTAESLLEALA